MIITNPIIKVLIPMSFQRKLLLTAPPGIQFSLVSETGIQLRGLSGCVRIRWILFDLLPELADMNIYHPIDDCNIVGRVKPPQKLIASEYFSGSGHEGSQ